MPVSGVERLLTSLTMRNVRWMIPCRGLHGMVSDNSVYVWFEGSVAEATLRTALADGLVSLGELERVPEYDLGRKQWRYEEGVQGRPITVTRTGFDRFFSRS